MWYAVWVRSGQEDRILELCKTFRHYHPDAYEESYGLPLAAYVKKLGKQAIHMAGVTQLLFGIRGKRWDNDKLYHTFFNKNWCYPSVEETPKGNGQVEGGTYWK